MKTEKEIFKQGSTTYYWSSKFFPPEVRKDVFELYSFVRTTDDYVDDVPPRPKEFFALKTAWKTREISKLSGINKKVLNNIFELARRHDFDKTWVDSFLAAMEADLLPRPHKTLEQSLQYVHGSAEVIGLMMARIMGLPKVADKTAQLQGRAMQWINFIRDIQEDDKLGRSYFPQAELKKFGLKNLSHSEVKAKPEAYDNFVRFQLKRYNDWQTAAQKGYQYIPRRMRIPLQTAADMYNWTARQIEKNPLIVFERKVKPSKRRVLTRAVWNLLHG